MTGAPGGAEGGVGSARVARVVVEADGGSRGNPGPAAYGALLRDAATGAVLAEVGATIGVASNNVAEYRGLIAGLRLARDVAPAAQVQVRMDSKLVVEQMSGRWKVKHPDIRPLVEEARGLAPAGTEYVWVPRDANAHADRLVNDALDGRRSGVTMASQDGSGDDPSLLADVQSPSTPPEHAAEELERPPARGWAAPGEATTLLLVRHGVTPHTSEKRFSGGLASANPGLSDEGRAQLREVADWLAPLAERVDAVVASPVRRTQESAAILAERLGQPVATEHGFAEAEFGSWDGLTFAEVAERDPAGLEAWLGSLEVAPGGGESFRAVEERVVAALGRVIEQYAGKTVAVVSHVTPIKTVVAHALGAPLESVFRMELTPASVSVVAFYPDGRASLRLFNALPPGRSGFDPDGSKW